MSQSGVELRIGGQSYRVVSTTAVDTLQHYAQLIDSKLRGISSSPAVHPDGLVLVALSLAHELEEERQRRQQIEQSSRENLQRLLQRIDAALDCVDENGEPLPPAPQLSPL
ncbi:MAG TPA: cell division protein ZapA [Polyangiaceae bacterium]|nr:cell division protein ZapA [Polyangiaceae bacterium]